MVSKIWYCLRLRNKDLVPNMTLSSLLNAYFHPKERGRAKHFFLLRVLAEAIYQRNGWSLCYRGSYFMINFSKRFWGVCAKKGLLPYSIIKIQMYDLCTPILAQSLQRLPSSVFVSNGRVNLKLKVDFFVSKFSNCDWLFWKPAWSHSGHKVGNGGRRHRLSSPFLFYFTRANWKLHQEI